MHDRLSRRVSAPLVAAIVIGSLAACSGHVGIKSEAGPELPSTSEPPSEVPSTPAGPTTNERGNIVMQIGEEATVTAEGATEPWLTFAIDAITVDAPCSSEYPESPENGHFVRLDLRAATGPNVPADAFFSISSFDFRIVMPDGVTVDTADTFAAYTCLADGESFTSDQLGPAQQYVGSIVLDSPSPSGVLMYQPYYGLLDGGWEWQF